MYIYILFSQKCKCSVFASNSLIDFAQKSLEGEPAVGMDMSMKNKLNTKRISVASQLTEQMLFFLGGGGHNSSFALIQPCISSNLHTIFNIFLIACFPQQTCSSQKKNVCKVQYISIYIYLYIHIYRYIYIYRWVYIISHIHPLIREYTLELNGFWRKHVKK